MSQPTVGTEPEPGVLYIVPTPLGHLGDLSPRAAHILGTVDRLLAEDTRVTRKLLSRLEARPSLVSCHDHNERQRATEVVQWLREDARVALVSDAGTPLVSDPGFTVARAVIDAGLRVVALPGPVAATTALSVSGLPPDRFSFVGFLPRKKKDLHAVVASVKARVDTLLFYASCHRVVAELAVLQANLGDRECAACRDLTKRGEWVGRGTLSDVLAELRGWDKVTGEWTVVVAGAAEVVQDSALSPAHGALIDALLRGGTEPRTVRDLVVAATGLPKKLVYQAVLERKEQR